MPSPPDDHVPTPRHAVHDYTAMLEAMAEEREAARRQAELDAQANLIDMRERRQFWRNVALAVFMAVVFNNPAAWIKALWTWLTNHVTVR
jgi:hypothetical protein